MLIRRRRGFGSMVGMVLLTLAAHSSGREALAASTTTTKASIPFDVYRDYLIVARGSAGPLKGLHFVVDTGASPSVVDRRLADRLHLEQTPASIAVVNGQVAAAQTVLPELEMGSLHRESLPVFVEDLSFFQSATPVPIDAVVGLDVLGQSSFEIDYVAHRIRFDDLDRLTVSLKFHVVAGLPIVDAEFDHMPVHLLFDTGASSIIVFLQQTARSASPVRVSMQQPASSNIGQFGRDEVWLRSLRLGGAEFGSRPAFVIGNRGESPQGFEGILSPVALGITHMTIDLPNEVVAFSRSI